jgi:branched-chain amino acid transport system permease protein
MLMLLLYGIVQLTKTGKAMRSVSEDKEVAALMGIDVDRIIQFTFALGGASAGIAGILYSLIYQNVHFYMGFIPGLKAFTAAVLGGIGNVVGAWLGGTLLGLIESLGPNLFLQGLGIPAANQLKDLIAFAILVFILIFRPSGILGERISKTKA